MLKHGAILKFGVQLWGSYFESFTYDHRTETKILGDLLSIITYCSIYLKYGLRFVFMKKQKLLRSEISLEATVW